MAAPKKEYGICVLCQETFEKNRFWQRFCCKKHQIDWNAQAKNQETESLRQQVESLKRALEKAQNGQ